VKILNEAEGTGARSGGEGAVALDRKGGIGSRPTSFVGGAQDLVLAFWEQEQEKKLFVWGKTRLRKLGKQKMGIRFREKSPTYVNHTQSFAGCLMEKGEVAKKEKSN